MAQQTVEDHAKSADRMALTTRLKAAVDLAVAELPDELIAAALAGRGEFDVITSALHREAPALGDDEVEDVRLAVAIRAFRGAQSASSKATCEQLMRAVVSQTDAEVLAHLISHDLPVRVEGSTAALAGSVTRTIEHRRVLKETAGEMLTPGQVQELVGITRQEVDKRRDAGELLALRLGSDWFFPAVQFVDGGTHPLMERVLKAHEGCDPWVVLDEILAENEMFGRKSLVDVIRDGGTKDIERYLRQLAGDGFA